MTTDLHPTPIDTPDERRDRDAFTALLSALSQPGGAYPLPASPLDPCVVVARALLDLETSAYTPDPTLAAALLATGARALKPERAAYHFYTAPDDAARAGIAVANRGTHLYPDRAATLILRLGTTAGRPQRWRGPGIDGERGVTLSLPAWFWQARAAAVAYPLGWDAVFVVDTLDGRAVVVGLPRTTHVSEG